MALIRSNLTALAILNFFHVSFHFTGRIRRAVLCGIICTSGLAASAGIIIKANTSAMTSAADWGGTAPAAGQTGEFDGTISAANEAALVLGGPITLDGLIFTNRLNGSVSVGGTANILTLGANGLDLSSANTNVTLGCAITLSAAQTWNSAKILTVSSNVVTGGYLLTLTNASGGAVAISGNLAGPGGLTVAGLGTNLLSGTNNYSGTTTVNGGSALRLLAGANNTSAGVSAALSAASALALKSGSTLQFRADSSTTFSPASLTLDGAADINNFDVAPVGTAAGKTLTLVGALAYGSSLDQTINVTGGSGYALGLGAISATATAHNPFRLVTVNVAPGLGAVIASFKAGNYGTWFNLTGGGNVTVTGNLANTSNGSTDLYVNGGTTATLQGSSVKSGTGDAYRYFVPNGTLVVDNSSALINNTTGTGLSTSWFVLGAVSNGTAMFFGGTGTGTYSPNAGALIATNNGFNCAVYLGDASFPNGGLTLAANVTNYVADGDVGFVNSGTMTIGGQNTSGINTYASPIILGWTLNKDKSVTLVAAAGGEVDFTGGIWQNGTNTTAGVKVGDASHSGIVKFTSANTYGGGTTVANGTLLINTAAGSGTGSGAVTVNAGATLGGSGIISGNVSVSGKTLPGINGATNTIGGNLTYNAGGAADFYLGSSAAAGGNDQIILNGASSVLNCGGVSVGINCGATLDVTTDYTLIKLTGGSAAISGSFNTTPVWLGTVPANSSYYSVATLASAVVLHYNATGATNVAAVTNLPASNVAGTSATLNGRLLSTGGQYPAVTFYYGPTDGGTNPAAWASSFSLGLQTGTFAATVFGLTGNTTYYFAASASNSAGVAWGAASKNFTTQVVTPPTVTNLPATAIYSAFATLNGQVLSTGNDAPTVRLFYGTNDGGANPAAWTNSIFLGAQTGAFSSSVAGLAGSTAYYFSASASNSAGVAWAVPSKSFTTLALTRVPVTTFHYDNTRQGQNTNETLLTLANVNVTNFGKLFTYAVDAYVYAQPLIMTNLAIPGQGTHNVVFVATENNSVYAFDADSNAGANGGLLWKINLGSPVPYTAVGSKPDGDMSPSNIGITGTPVIDPVSATMYLDTGTYTNGVYTHLVHALSLTNGTERSFSPVVVTASVPGTASDGNGSVVSFIAQYHAARESLTLAGGTLYVGYGSYQDRNSYHGWLIGFNPANLVQLASYVFNANPNTTIGAFWNGGGGPVVDSNTNLYLETANGIFDVNTGGPDYGDSFVKLATTNNGLSVADYFTPYNQLTLKNGDVDLGSGAPMLLPDSAGSAAHPHLIVGAGKQGTVYLLDRDNLGHYNGTDGINGSDSQIIQSVIGAVGNGVSLGGSYATPAYWNNRIFYTAKTDKVRAFTITNGVIVATPQSVSATAFGPFTGSPVVSANGTNNAIVWVTDPGAYASSGPAVLHAYNATNLALELYNSSLNLARDNPGGAVKMTAPVVTGGKVYVGAEFALSVFGPAIFLNAPVLSPAGGTFTNSVLVALADSTAGVSIYYTLDGTTPTAGSTLYSGPFLLTSNALIQAIALSPGAVNSAVTGASFINTAAAGNGVGLFGQYWTNTTSVAFTNVSFNTPATLVRTDAVVNFNWSAAGPDPAIGQTNFTVRWTGSLQPQFNETYTLTTIAHDGVRLWVNGQLLINDWTTHPASATNSAAIAFNSQQLYNLRLDYFQNTGGAAAQLLWTSPSTPSAVVPQTQLYPFTNPPPAVVLTAPAGSATNFTAAASVTISADADALYNPISAVNFYAGGAFLGSVTNLPYTLTATGLAAGNYALTAVAVDGSGLSSTSSPVSITVATGSGLAYGLTGNVAVSPFLNLPVNASGPPPVVLSGTGAFSDTANRIPAAGLIPYAPNAPQWKDNAVSSWFMALPNNGGVLTPGEQIQFQPTNYWTFPAGSVFVKNFDLVVNATNPAVPVRRLETELLVRDNSGSVYGLNYKWRPDHSDADLLTDNFSEDILVTNATGVQTQTWYYASSADCQECHNSSVAGNPAGVMVLGLNARQLNGNLTYPATGVTDNQLRTLNRLGRLNPAINESAIGGYAQLTAMTNLSASLENRVRSYLDANCEACHQPGGQGPTWDARCDTPLAQQDITNFPAEFSLGISDNACIVKSKDVWRSVLLARINTLDQDIQMPDFRNLIDTNAVQVITDWINSLPGTPALAPPAIAPDGGSYIGSINVALSPPDPNAAIYYTLDGSLPTTNSLRYAGPFSLFTNQTVSASAFETNFINSAAASASFNVQPLYFAAENFLVSGPFQMGFVGVAGSNYVLLASTNLTSWTPVSTNLETTNQFNLFDPKATNFPLRFYRVQMQ